MIKGTLIVRHFKFCPVIGLGYWKDIYTILTIKGYAHNVILPFIRIQFAYLDKNEQDLF